MRVQLHRRDARGFQLCSRVATAFVRKRARETFLFCKVRARDSHLRKNKVRRAPLCALRARSIRLRVLTIVRRSARNYVALAGINSLVEKQWLHTRFVADGQSELVSRRCAK